MAATGLPEPVFINRRNEFIVVLYNGAKTEIAQPQQDLPDEIAKLLAFCKTPKSRKEIADYLGIGTVFYATKHYVQPLLDSEQLAMTIPEKPKSRNQKFFTK